MLNAADEVAVAAFLDERIPFTGIAAVIERVLEEMPAQPVTTSTTSSPPTPRPASAARRDPGVDYGMSWLLVFLGFCLLIMLHEAGHFFAAKATGMRVERFFLFFGPTIWSFKRGETEYGVKSIPLGGYVKITGMNPEEEIPPEVPTAPTTGRRSGSAWSSIAAGPAVNIALAFVILFAVFKIGGLEASTSRSADPGQSPAAKVLQPGDRIVAVDGHRFANLDSTETARKVRQAGRLAQVRRQAGRGLRGADAGAADDRPRRPGADALGHPALRR